MAAGGGDLQRPLGGLLALDVGQVRQVFGAVGNAGFRPRHDLGAAEMVGHGDQAAWRQDGHLGARPGRFRSAGGRADQAVAGGVGGHGGGQDPGNGGDGAVERQFAERGETVELVAGDGADRRHQRQCDRQIVMAALLGQVGRSQIDDDALGRQGQAGGVEGGADALAAFGHRLVGQADDDEIGQARGDLDLDVDADAFNALKCDGGDA